MNKSSVCKEAAVASKEIRRGEAFGGFLHLRVGEGEPDLLHLARSEEAVDNLDVCAQESYVLQPFLQRLCGTAPHTRTLDIHPDEVAVGITAGQPHSILSASAAQLQDYRVVVLEEILTPAPTHLTHNVFELPHRKFEDVRVGCHIGKLGQFPFTHGFFNS